MDKRRTKDNKSRKTNYPRNHGVVHRAIVLTDREFRKLVRALTT